MSFLLVTFLLLYGQSNISSDWFFLIGIMVIRWAIPKISLLMLFCSHNHQYFYLSYFYFINIIFFIYMLFVFLFQYPMYNKIQYNYGTKIFCNYRRECISTNHISIRLIYVPQSLSESVIVSWTKTNGNGTTSVKAIVCAKTILCILIYMQLQIYHWLRYRAYISLTYYSINVSSNDA